MKKYKLSRKRPENFDHAIVCAGGYFTFEGRLLLLKRHPKKLFGDCWGVPGGKLEEGESPEEGMIREVFEEIGFVVDRSLIEPICILYIESEPRSHEVTYHMFYYPLDKLPILTLHLDEHLEEQWVTPSEALELPLVTAGGIEALLIYQDFVVQKMDHYKN
ncbi:MAG: NUDIX hydrolase [Parachlamydiaceae bacterium]|nr:NUDIX hydrolase [Parachlamydiaceae bacterium]